jgi:hypothetical protein
MRKEYSALYIRLLLAAACVSLTGLSILAQTPDATPKPSPSAQPQVELVFDLSTLPKKNPGLFGKVAEALLRSSQTNLSKEDYLTQFSKKQDIYKLVAEKYGFNRNVIAEKLTAEALARSIRIANGLSAAQRLVSGQIKLPPFFSKPSEQKSYYTQVWNIEDTPDSVQLLHVGKAVSAMSAGADEVAYATAVNLPLKAGSVAQVVLTADQYQHFKKSLTTEELRTLTSSGAFDIGTEQDIVDADHPEAAGAGFVGPGPAPSPAESSLPAPDQLPLDLSVGQYYIVDFFAQKDLVRNPSDDRIYTCSHGAQVEAVARKSLKEYGADALQSKIHVKEFNYFLAPQEDRNLIEEYINNAGFSPSMKVRKLKELEELKTYVPDNTKKQTSMLYIQALYWSLLSKPDTAVISSSTYAKFDFYQPMPITFDQTSAVPLLNAVLNDANSDINNPQYQPLRYFFDTGIKLPTVLVGATKGQSHEGMSDIQRKGGVTSIAPGSWVVPIQCDEGTVELNIWGASFATPALGAMLLTAQSYWRAKGKEPNNALDMRRRLLLAGEPREDFIGFFASGGIPSLKKLLVSDQPFLIDKSGAIKEIAFAPGQSTITIGSTTVDLKKPDESLRISGIVVNSVPTDAVTCNAFVFFEASKRWECRAITDLSLNLVDESKPITWADFKANYKELILP